MAKKGLTRRQLLKEPDEFFTLTGKIIDWGRRNVRRLVFGVAAVFGVIVLISGYGYYRDSRVRSASMLLSQSLAHYQSQDKTAADNLATVTEGFNRLITNYGQEPAGRLGEVVFAHLHLLGASLDDAVQYYQRAMQTFGSDPSLENVILNGLASAYEQKGEIEAAIGVFEKIVQSKSAILKDTALFHLGRLYAQSGQAEKSVQVYGQLHSEFPNSVFAPIAREKMAG